MSGTSSSISSCNAVLLQQCMIKQSMWSLRKSVRQARDFLGIPSPLDWRTLLKYIWFYKFLHSMYHGWTTMFLHSKAVILDWCQSVIDDTQGACVSSTLLHTTFLHFSGVAWWVEPRVWKFAWWVKTRVRKIKCRSCEICRSIVCLSDTSPPYTGV